MFTGKVDAKTLTNMCRKEMSKQDRRNQVWVPVTMHHPCTVLHDQAAFFLLHLSISLPKSKRKKAVWPCEILVKLVHKVLT